jgi:hypothetical protein
VRGALLDSLRTQFGEHSARECKWRYERDPRQSGCPLLSATASR